MALNVDKTPDILFSTRERNLPKYKTMIINGYNINEVEYTNICVS